MSIRVLVADDQAMICGALASLLDLEPDITVVAQASNGREAVEALAPAAQSTDKGGGEDRVDVAILDIEMPVMDGITATETIRRRFPATRVLMVTTFGRPGYLQRALDAGATGFMVKDAPVDQLADAVRRVAQGLRERTATEGTVTWGPTGSTWCVALAFHGTGADSPPAAHEHPVIVDAPQPTAKGIL